MNTDLLLADLRRDEGVRKFPYKDTVGKLTIGVGRNLEDKPLSKEEVHQILMETGLSERQINRLLRGDVDDVVSDLDRALPWWRRLSEPRQRALANMCFNLGLPRLLGFRRMLRALEAGLYAEAAGEALNSKWARQVGKRANRIAAQISGG